MISIHAAMRYSGQGTIYLFPNYANYQLNPCAAIAAGAGTLAALGTTYILPVAGFGAAGIKAGSIAAGVQATVYGASVPAGGVFATLQSAGVTGALAGTLGVAAVPVGIVVAGGAYVVSKKLGA